MARKSIPAEVTRRLFVDSAGYCQNPGCLRELFPKEMSGLMHIAERAHIIPYGNGPRIEQKPDANFDVNSFENLIMLCPSCSASLALVLDFFCAAVRQLYSWDS